MPWTPFSLAASSAQAALAGHLEDDLRALADLVERDLLALGLVDEVLRVGVDRLDARVGLLGPRLVARDVVVDGRDLLATDARDDLLATLLLDVEPGHVAHEVAGLLLLEDQPVDVLGLALEQALRVVDDREVHARERLRDLGGGVGHEEPDRDD